jgi:hypothetical protein
VPALSRDLIIGLNLTDPNPAFGEVDASFDGLLDKVMSFNRALSPREIGALAQVQR